MQGYIIYMLIYVCVGGYVLKLMVESMHGVQSKSGILWNFVAFFEILDVLLETPNILRSMIKKLGISKFLT